MKEVKELLYNTYDKLKVEKAIEMCNRIQATHVDCRYSEVWKVVNEMTGGKKAKEGQVAGASPEDQIATWITDFKNLLSTVPGEENFDEDIPPVYSNLDINYGPLPEKSMPK
jgi:hypothetical protein